MLGPCMLLANSEWLRKITLGNMSKDEVFQGDRVRAFLILLGAGFFSVSSANAQLLHCETINSGYSRSPRAGDPATATALLSNRPDLPSSYQITGGGCDFSTGDGSQEGHSPVSMPIAGGYQCVLNSVSNTVARARAFAIACGVRPHIDRTRTPFSNVGLGGNTIAIARTGQRAIPYSIRVCNVAGGQPIDVVLSGMASDNKRVGVGQCVDVDNPQRAGLQILSMSTRRVIIRCFNPALSTGRQRSVLPPRSTRKRESR